MLKKSLQNKKKRRQYPLRLPAPRFVANSVAAAIPVETDELMGVRTTDLPRIDMHIVARSLSASTAKIFEKS